MAGETPVNERAEITEHGLFWRQDSDQRKLWGTLRIRETNEARLETFGSLIDFEERSAINIIGQIKGGFGWVTLINCFPVNTKNPVPIREGETDWSHQTLHVNQAVDGIAFEKGEEVAFEEAILDISTLSRWVDPRLVEAHLAKGDISPFRTDLSVREREDETAILNFRGERIRVSIRFIPKGGSSREGVISRYSVEDHCTLVIETPDGTKLPLESFLSVTGSILNLLSICCNETPAVKEFLVRYEKQAVPPGRAFVRMRGHSVEQEKRRGSPSPNFTRIGGAEGLAKWIEVAETYQPLVGLLTSNWFNKDAYHEDKFARMYTAVEGLITRRAGRNRARVKFRELAQFMEQMVPGISNFTKTSVEDWAERVKDIRDQKISHSDPTSTVVTDGRDIIMMTNLLYVAGAAFLLREIGLEEQHIEEYVSTSKLTLWLSEQQ